jgi:hypothetical protein
LSETSLPLSVTAALDDYIESVEEPREPDGKYHPSQFWGCDRQTIYALRGVERSNPPDKISKRRFKIGHTLHELIQEAIGQSPSVIRFYPEFTIGDPDYNTAGHGDGLAFFDDGTVVVVEIKSIRAAAFKFGLPKADHVKQAGTYAVHARTKGVWVDDDAGKTFIPPLGDRLIGLLMAYFEKEDLKTFEDFVPYDDQWELDLEQKVSDLQPYRDDPESLPPRLPLVKGKKAWNCNYCDWRDRCWKIDPAKREPVPSGEPVTVEHW